MYKQYLKTVMRYSSNNFNSIKNDTVRVRFAPSPTGYLHLGGLRTALYNYLFAKKYFGKFILRIEDTDQTRIIEDAAEQLYNDLRWSGIVIDEGPNIGGSYGPYIQSQRMDLYREQVEILLDNNTAYYCFCTNKRLELLRKEAARVRQIPKYDNRCRHLRRNEALAKLKNGENYCIRFKLLPGPKEFQDMIYGNITYDITLTEGDPVIMKSDGFPTYHFANVVDDHFMQISHVLRGVEWQISTTKHLMMYRAFNWKPPIYGHLPLLMNADGTKLSKRQGDIQISHYRNSGILSQALINFITNSGGGFEKDQLQNVKPKCYTMEELARQFDVEKINVSSGKLMSERLTEFNRLEIQRQLKNPKDERILVEKVKELIQHNISTIDDSTLLIDTSYIQGILNWAVNRINMLSDLISKDFIFLWVIPKYESDLKPEETEIIFKLDQMINDVKLDNWTREYIDVILKKTAKDNDFPYRELMKLSRSVLSGLKEGPSVGEMIYILGKENTVARLKMCLERNSHS